MELAYSDGSSAAGFDPLPTLERLSQMLKDTFEGRYESLFPLCSSRDENGKAKRDLLTVRSEIEKVCLLMARAPPAAAAAAAVAAAAAATTTLPSSSRASASAGRVWVTEVWENSRYVPFHWGAPFGMDRPQWSDADGNPALAPSETQPAKGWVWDGEWEVSIVDGQTDGEGWSYALNFVHTWHAKKGFTDVVRRRRHARRQKEVVLAPAPAPEPTPSSPVAQAPARRVDEPLSEGHAAYLRAAYLIANYLFGSYVDNENIFRKDPNNRGACHKLAEWFSKGTFQPVGPLADLKRLADRVTQIIDPHAEIKAAAPVF